MKNALIAVLCLTLTATAQASGWYVSAYGGANFDDVISSKLVDAQTGLVIGGTVGKKIDGLPGVRVEADLSFRQNQVEIFGGKINADHDTVALLGNIIWDVPVAIGPLHPYLLAGAGYANTQATFEDVAILRLEASGLAYQLGAGVNTTVAPGVVLGLGYRFMQAPEVEVLGTQLSDGTNHSLLASVAFTFD